MWTAANQAAATRPQTVQYGKKWIGHRVADCSGLGYWAFKELGGSIFHGSNTIWKEYVTDRSMLKFGVRTDGKEVLPGDPVFLIKNENGKPNRHHIGYYVGVVDGVPTCIEARSTMAGVVTSPLSHWDEVAHWKNVEYEGGVVFMDHPILKKGDKGPDVVNMQNLLVKNGYKLPATKTAPNGVDGIFGANTETVLKQFQSDKNLEPTGICNEKTWDALEGGVEPTPVTEGVLTELEAKELLDLIEESATFLRNKMKK